MAQLAIGQPAPSFSLPADDGSTFSLDMQKGRPVVLFFYPQDDTPSCTNENIAFSKQREAFEAAGALLVGISPDSLEKHQKFRAKYNLEHVLVADPDHVAIDAYGVWGPKKTFGKEYDGLIRSTFLIDSEGLIAAKWTVARVAPHTSEVLEAVHALGPGV